MHSADEQFLISLKEVVRLHDSALARDGGMPGLADRPGLLSALGGARSERLVGTSCTRRFRIKQPKLASKSL